MTAIYRICEVLRNHTQHASTPIDGISFPSGRLTNEADSLVEYSLDFNIQRATFEGNKKITKKKIDGFDPIIDLKQVIRSYIKSLQSIHNTIRSLIDESVADSQNTISSAIDQYKKAYPEYRVGLHIIKNKRNDSVKYPVSLEWDKVRIEIINKSKPLTNLDRKFVSGTKTTKW